MKPPATRLAPDPALDRRMRTAPQDPKYMYGQFIADYEHRIDMDRLRRERVRKLHQAMAEDDIGALLLYNPDHIRYATSSKYLTPMGYPRFFRYALVPRDADPLLFEIVGAEMDTRLMTAPWLEGRLRPAIIWHHSGPATETQAAKWARSFEETLRAEGVLGQRIATDRVDLPMLQALDERGMSLIDGSSTVNKAMAVKTADELEILKITCSIGDAAYVRLREEIRPGIKETELYGIAAKEVLSMGWEDVPGMVVASGGHTYPYLRDVTDKRVRYGDLVIVDLYGHYMGYWGDLCRTFVCGKATQTQKDLHARCLDMLHRAMDAVRPGATSADVANALPAGDVDDHYGTLSMLQFVHGLGMTIHDPPLVSTGFSKDYPMEIKENMYMAAETYATDGREGVRLEHNFVVTSSGVEVFDLYPWDAELHEG